MHPYVIDSEERVSVVCCIALLSVLFAWGLGELQTMLNFSFPWWVDAPSVLGFFGLFYKLVDRCLWNSRVFQRLGVTKTPDLNGNWNVEICSSHNNFASVTIAEVTIKQSWTRLSVSLKGMHSRSASRIASILIDHPGQPLITYEYINEPNFNALPTMHIHYGFTRLYLSDDKLNLTGDYYTGRDRSNWGTLSLVKQAP